MGTDHGEDPSTPRAETASATENKEAQPQTKRDVPVLSAKRARRWAGISSKWFGAVASGIAIGILTPLTISIIHEITARSSKPVPLTATVQLGDGGCPSWWIIHSPGPQGAVMPAPGQEPVSAVLVSGSWIGITLQGLVGHTVIVQSMRADVIARRLPKGGTQIPASICQGSIEPSYFTFNLDHKTSFAIPVAEKIDSTNASIGHFPFVVREDEPEQFYVRASTSRQDVMWRIVLRWSSDGTQGNLIVGNGTLPLEVSSADHAPKLCLDMSDSKWLPRSVGKCTNFSR